MTIVFYSKTIQIEDVYMTKLGKFKVSELDKVVELVNAVSKAAEEQGLSAVRYVLSGHGSNKFIVAFSNMKVFGRDNSMVSLKCERL